MKLGRWALGSALVALVCGCGNGSEGELRPSSAQHYDAVTVFRAIYFSDGAAANAVKSWKLPRKDAPAAKTRTLSSSVVAEQVRAVAGQYGKDGLKATSSKMLVLADAIEKSEVPPNVGTSEQEEATKKLLLVRIKKGDPKFFTRFATAIQSGKHVLVEKALSEGTARLVAAATDEAAPELPTNGFAAPEEDDFQSFGGYGDGSESEDDGLDDEDLPSDDEDGAGDEQTLAGGGSGGGKTGAGKGGTSKGGASGSGSSSGSKTGSKTGSGGNKSTPPKSGGGKTTPPKSGGTKGAKRGDQAGLQMNVTVYVDTALAIDKVIAAYATLFVGNDGDGTLRSASYVDHLTNTFAK